MKIAVVSVFLLALAFPASAEQRGPKQASDEQSDTSAAVRMDFPVVAKDQSRQWIPVTNPAECVSYPDGTTNCNYTLFGCNCKRECTQSDPYNCKLRSLTQYKCKIPYAGATCEQCDQQDCGD